MLSSTHKQSTKHLVRRKKTPHLKHSKCRVVGSKEGLEEVGPARLETAQLLLTPTPSSFLLMNKLLPVVDELWDNCDRS